MDSEQFPGQKHKWVVAGFLIKGKKKAAAAKSANFKVDDLFADISDKEDADLDIIAL